MQARGMHSQHSDDMWQGVGLLACLESADAVGGSCTTMWVQACMGAFGHWVLIVVVNHCQMSSDTCCDLVAICQPGLDQASTTQGDEQRWMQ